VVPSEKMVSIGVLTFGDALMSSSKRGRPNVTFLALFPALWNVFLREKKGWKVWC